MITDPIEALEKIAKISADIVWICEPNKNRSDDNLLDYVQNGLIYDLDEIATICDIVLFREGLK